MKFSPHISTGNTRAPSHSLRRRAKLLIASTLAALMAAPRWRPLPASATAPPRPWATPPRPPPTAGCGKAPALSSGAHTIVSGGTTRGYILTLPANYDRNHPYRLIFAFHWLNGTDTEVANGVSVRPYYGLQDLAKDTTIFVAPQGISNGWANTNGRDVAFVDAMLKQFEAGLCVDTTRIFSAGFSYGAGMTYALACDARRGLPRGRGLLRRTAERMQRRHAADRVPRLARHQRPDAQLFRRPRTGRPLRAQQPLHDADPTRTGEGQPRAYRHRLQELLGRAPGRVDRVRWRAHRNLSYLPGLTWQFFTQF